TAASCPIAASISQFIRFRDLTTFGRLLHSLLISLDALVEIDRPFTHQNRRPTNPRSRNHAGFLLRASDESARTPHLHSLRNPPAKHPVRLVPMSREQPPQRAVGPAGRRILRNAAQRREHPSANIKHIPIPSKTHRAERGLVNPGVQVQLRVDLPIAERLESAHIDASAFQRGTISQFREDERKTDRTNLWSMRVCHDVIRAEGYRRRDEIGPDGFSESKRLRGR